MLLTLLSNVHYSLVASNFSLSSVIFFPLSNSLMTSPRQAYILSFSSVLLTPYLNYSFYFGTLASEILIFLICEKHFITIFHLLRKNEEKAMATHSSTLAWKLPWTEEPGRLQSMGLQRVRHDWSDFIFTFMHWRRKWQPTPVFLPEESQGRGSLVGCRLWGRTESDTTEVT